MARNLAKGLRLNIVAKYGYTFTADKTKNEALLSVRCSACLFNVPSKLHIESIHSHLEGKATEHFQGLQGQ